MEITQYTRIGEQYNSHNITIKSHKNNIIAQAYKYTHTLFSSQALRISGCHQDLNLTNVWLGWTSFEVRAMT